MKIIANDKDITNLCVNATWSGDIDERSRSLSFTYLYNHKISMTLVKVEIGNSINLFDDKNRLLYVGVVTEVSSSLSNSDVSITSRDVLWYLGKNKLAGVYKGSAETITRRILDEFNIPVGSLESIAIDKTIISTGDKTIYKAISEAYGDNYYIAAVGEKVEVRKKGSEVVAVISGNANLIDANYKKSMENMINRVIVLDDNNKRVYETSAEENLKYGILQDVIKAEKDKDVSVSAKEKLVGINDTSNINAIGDFNVISGKAVIIQDTSNGFTGKFLVTGDSHSIGNGEHTMSLTVEVLNE
jgi:phage-like element pbsx protein xkdQ|nr:MAG TPA: 43 kDa tail protein [Caudoviricetes sp.]